MRHAQITVSAALLALATLGPPAARAAEGEYKTTYGSLCGLSSISAPTNGLQTAELDAGPLFLGYGEHNNPAGGGAVTCSVQVDAPYYNGRNVATASSRGGGRTLVVPPTPVTYAVTGESTVYVCTQVTIFGDRFPMYLDDLTNRWTRDPAVARCTPVVLTVETAPSTRSAGNGKANGHKKVKDPDSSEPVPTPPPPNTPVYPTGSVDISKDPTGPVTYYYDVPAFTPAFPLWVCAYGTASVTCTPPAPPSGNYNVCGEVAADATSKATGTITATSACAFGTAASVSSTGPVLAAQSSTASPNTAFSWTCSAADGGALMWTIHCEVGV